jgi:hypothetical protein
MPLDGDAPRFARISEGHTRALPATGCGVALGYGRSGREALYAACVSERAPRVVYSACRKEVENEAQRSLRVNMNTVDADELDELPEVGSATAEAIIEYRRTNWEFRWVGELLSIRNCKTRELRFYALLYENGPISLKLARL